jgi:2-polyprenyl-6-methoxyphenol hydroxylase-like FAD-dependent oxidoreductase
MNDVANAKRVLVIGGGIVGLATALELRRARMEVVVCEQAPEIRAAGASLGLWQNALAVFDGLGLTDQVQAIGKPSEMWMHNAAGTRIETPGYSIDDHSYLLLHRAKLSNMLADEVGRSRIRLNAHFTGYIENADSVTAHFSDGSTEEADLLIGADGAYSAVRAQLLPDSPPQEHRGHHAWRAVLPPGEVSVDRDIMVVGHNSSRGGYARTYDGGTFWLLSQFNSPELTGTKKEQSLQRAQDINDNDWNAKLVELIEATPEERILHNQIMIVPPLPRWTSARVALVGDAAHAMSPHLAAGASLGVEDGALLADRLLTLASLPEALASYEADRIPHYERVMTLSKAVEHSETPEEFAANYVAFSHWMINQSAAVELVT